MKGTDLAKQMLILTSAPRLQGWSSNTFIAEMRKRYEVRATYWIGDTKTDEVDIAQRDDFLHTDEVAPPDVIVVDGWLTTKGQARVPLDWLRERIAQGAQAVMLNVYPEQRITDPGAGIFPFSWATPEVAGEYLQGRDDFAAVDNNPSFIWCNTSELWGVTTPYLRQSYEGLRGVGVKTPVALNPSGDILATTPGTTKLLSNLDLFQEPGLPMIWAHCRPLRLGHVVSIAGSITQDAVLDHCPDNSKWLLQLFASLDEHSYVLGKPRADEVGVLTAPMVRDGLEVFMQKELVDDLAHRWDEARRSLESGATLACIIMLGGVLEGLLGALLDRIAPKELAKLDSCPRTPKGAIKPMSAWSLEHRIDVASRLRLIDVTSADYASRARDYRNYVHPGKGPASTFTARDAIRIADLIDEIRQQVLANRHGRPDVRST